MKLIGPEFNKMNESQASKAPAHHTTSVSISGPADANFRHFNSSMVKSRSRDNLTTGHKFAEAVHKAGDKGKDNVSELSFHMARPATVVSNHSSASSLSANTSGRSERFVKI